MWKKNQLKTKKIIPENYEEIKKIKQCTHDKFNMHNTALQI